MTLLEPPVTKEVYRVTLDGEQVWRAAYELAGQRYELAGEWPLDQKFEAERALDEAVYRHLQHETLAPAAADEELDELPPPDPTTPFSTPGGPAPAWQPTPPHLELALEHLTSFYPDGLVQSTRKGTQTIDIPKLAAKARQALLEREWLILQDGSLIIGGSKGDTYLVRDESCARVMAPYDPADDRRDPSVWSPVMSTSKGGKRSPATCPGFQNHGHMCYHALARELLRLSQVLAEREAVAELDARLLSGYLYAAAVPHQPVGLQVLPHGFVINAGGAHAVLPAETDGSLTAEFTVPTERFAEFWESFKPVARLLASQEDSPTAQVWLSPRAREVNILVEASDFHYRLAA